ncbi:MAG TPA: hypothetical protein VIE64_07570 [Solirubrobacterales bacterium]|jgi:hypothetical protein
MTPPGPAEPSLPDKVISIHERLTTAEIPHAIGGALALAYYAEPRATIDIDLNIFVPAERWQEVVDALAPLGVNAEDLDSEALLRDGQCRLWWGDNPVDLFFAYDPIHEAMRKASRQVPFAETTLPILSPEHLTVCKAMFDRPKDWLDIEQILVATDELDLAEIEGWLKKMVGGQDHRMRRLEELKVALSIED